MPVCNFKKGTEISVACCGAAKKDYNNGQRVTVISFVISLERRERARGGGLPVVMVLICLFSFQVIHKIVLLIHNNAYSEDSEQKRKKKALEPC